MTEGLRRYQRWTGTPSSTPAWRIIAQHEMRVTLAQWLPLMVFLVGFVVIGIGSVGQLYEYRNADFGSADETHSFDWFLAMLSQVHWAALVFAALIGANAVLGDARSGALEMIQTRGVGRGSYFGGKAAAVTGLTFGMMAVPIVLYYVTSLALYDNHPENWLQAAAWGLVDAAVWALMCSGIAMGIASVSRAVWGGIIFILGTALGLHIFVGRLLAAITENEVMTLFSPHIAMKHMGRLWWDIESESVVDPKWGAAVVVGLLVIGWLLAIMRHPRGGDQDD